MHEGSAGEMERTPEPDHTGLEAIVESLDFILKGKLLHGFQQGGDLPHLGNTSP